MKIEICTDSVEGALAAQAGGAQRIELCDNLIEGGTTPSAGMIATVRRAITTIGLNVIIRPRGGDFCCSDHEFAVMQHDIGVAKALGADGVVIGLLLPDGTIDRPRCAELVALARPLSVTFHRAFDMSVDPFAALETLIELGIDRVLTSGQEPSALEGLELIKALVRRASERIIVMPGGGVNERNVGKIVAESGVREVHLSARGALASRMTYRNTRIFMGGALYPEEYTRKVTDAGRVQSVVSVCQSLPGSGR